MFDVVIKNGLVLDGTGAPGYRADIGVRGDRIAAIGDIPGEASRVIDNAGSVVTPGFIDLHAHSDLSFLIDPLADSKLRQGVTLELVGNCGMSYCAPLNKRTGDIYAGWLSRMGGEPQDEGPGWTEFGGWLDTLSDAGSVINVATQIGHNQVRSAVIGADARAPSYEEIEAMRRIVAEALDAGAMGFSTGLYFPPGYYSLTDEIITLNQEAADRNRLYSSHTRSESDEPPGLFVALNEAIEIGRRTGGRIEVSHVKAHGPRVWDRSSRILETMRDARRDGVDVAGDQYPYTACGTPLSGAIFNRWAHDGGRPALLERIGDADLRQRLSDEAEYAMVRFQGPAGCVISGYDPDHSLEGQTLAEVAETRNADPITTAFDLLLDGEVSVVLTSMCDSDVDIIAGGEMISVASDGMSLRTEGPLSAGKPHPRSYGTNARFIQRMVLERNVVGLEEAIRKMTTLPAQRLGLENRGRIAPGGFADIAVFVPEAMKEHATFADPHQYSTGVSHVLVNGRLAIDSGVPTGKTAGRVIRDNAG
ncbi:MAG TPA: D-aminoacylase [Dehalococcoidia bacterium]|jgi:N-acyl-D-amino-acid deacylase|nr:N-acyl-D-amino-acid deacylase [Chloroflexota bacterium]MDP5876427.1 D-aminoacylase [Dehalococcoidia bacterium]MDP6273517.1 D-aminoacylase [Dehalococcoidia bacterium]MDP7160304.1 D-aminoacylase [Dehalococcoidia bacterium]MDP7213501.1 D-aminoacylase [Dehalococcoidia bacterium]